MRAASRGRVKRRATEREAVWQLALLSASILFVVYLTLYFSQRMSSWKPTEQEEELANRRRVVEKMGTICLVSQLSFALLILTSRTAEASYVNKALSGFQSVAQLAMSRQRGRHLQLDNIDGDLCLANGTQVNFEEGLGLIGFETVAFDDQFEPNCACEQISNLEDLTNFGQAGEIPSDLNVFVEEFNTLLGTIESNTAYDCINNCESCFDNGGTTLCGVVTTDTQYALSFKEGDFDLASLLEFATENANATETDQQAFGADVLQDFLDTFNLKSSVCVLYTVGLRGQICLKVEIDETDIIGEDNVTALPCTLSLGGVACDSCIFNAEQVCLTAVCSVHGMERIDSCTGVGLVEHWSFLLPLVNDQTNLLTPGRCDLDLAEYPTRVPDQSDPVATDKPTSSAASLSALVATAAVAFAAIVL